jgi:hypothetical protein
MLAGGLAANRESRSGEAVEFVSADRGAISVSLAHSSHGAAPSVQQTDCRACHKL